MIKALIGSAISNKKNEGQIVKQEKPAMKPFITEVERVKTEAVSDPSQSLLPPAPSVREEKIGGQKPKGVKPKARLISKKLDSLKSLFSNRLKSIRSTEERKRKDTEKEKRGKRENLLEKMKIGGIASAVAPITRPFMSFWDQVLNAVGSIILAIIGKWAIDNPQVFVGAIKTLERALDTIANVFVVTVDLFASIIDGVDKIEQAFGSFIKGTFGEDAFSALENMGGTLTQLFDASLLLGGLLLQYTLSELMDSDDGGKPGKDKPGKDKPSVVDGKEPPKAKVKPTTKATTIQDTAIGSPQRKLAAKIQRQHGHTARRIFENKYDDLISQGKSPYQANKSAKAAVEKAIRKGQIKSQPQTGNLLGRKLKQKVPLKQRITRAPRQTAEFLKRNRMRIKWGGPPTSQMPAVTRGARAVSEYGMGAARAGARATAQVAKTAPAKIAGGLQQVFGKGVDRATQRFFIKVLGKGGVQGLKKMMGKIPIIGPLLVFGLNWASGESILRSGAMAVGSGLGQLLGTWAGGAIGAIGGPAAPITVPLGGFIGSMLGGMGGEMLGGWLYDLFIKTNPDGSSSMNTSGEVGKNFRSGVAKLFNQDWKKIGKGFVDWLLKTMRGVANSAWGIISSMVEFMGGVSLIKAILKVFNDMRYVMKVAIEKVKKFDLVGAGLAIKSGLGILSKLFINPGPWGFLWDNAIKPFFKNVSNLWNSRDKFWDFLTRRGTFQEVTGAISGGVSAAGQGLAGAAGSVSSRSQTSAGGNPFMNLATPTGTGSPGELLSSNAKTTYYDPSLGGINASGYKTKEGLPATSTGEGYRPNVFSAAAFPPLLAKLPRSMTVPAAGFPGGRTLKKPVNVIVTNSKGKKAVIRVNDVGPGVAGHASNHMLDFSVAAKNYLGTGGGFTIHMASPGSRPGPLTGDVPFQLQNTPTQNQRSVTSIPTPTSQPMPEMTPPRAPVLPSPTAAQITSSQISSTPATAQLAPSTPSTPSATATSTISQQAPYDKNGKVNPLLLPLPSAGGQGGAMMPGGGAVASQGLSNSWVLNYYYIQQISAFLYKQG